MKISWHLFATLAVVCTGSVLLPGQVAPQAPPQFTTIPVRDRMLPASLKNGHEVFVPPVAGSEIGDSGTAAPHGKGGGGGGRGKTQDFGQPAAVAMTPSCFPSSTNNVDATCAPDSYQGEPMLSADPLGRLVGAENDIYPGNCSATAASGSFGDCGLSATVSVDGASWQCFKLSRTWGGHSFLIGYDPSAAVDSQGRYFVAYGVGDGGSSDPNGLAVASSADGGATWTKTNAPVLNLRGGQFEDKPWLAADGNPGSPFHDRLYLAWDRNSGFNQILMVSTSSDQGKTWSAPLKINDGTLSFERVIYAFPTVAPNGTVYVLWHDYLLSNLVIDKSTDGGVSWGTDVHVAATDIGFGVDIGCDGGREMTPAPQMAVAPNGDLYIVYVLDNLNSPVTDLDVMLTKSTDGGATWSAPRRVSADTTPSFTAGHQYNPAISIDSLGRINVTYLDRRDDAANCATHTYLSRSSDGGSTFADSRVSNPGSDGLGSNFDGNPNGPGDYSGTAALGSVAHPYFADHRVPNGSADNVTGSIAGGFEIYTASVP